MIVQKNKLLFFKFVSILSILVIIYTEQVSSLNSPYYGKFIGKLSELHHGVSGEVYAVDGRTLHLKDFTYDGEGPAAYFYVGNSKEPNGNGIRIRDERGSAGVIKRYRKKSITLTLPEGKTLNNIKWFSVWCDEFSVNFGDVKIPRNFDFPRPQKIEGLNGVHKIKSDSIVVVDAQTLLIPNLSYDGEAPDAKFWVGRGSKPSPQGIRIPDENSSIQPLRQYDRKTVVLTLPTDLTIFDIGHFGIWCEAFTVDFGHVIIPNNLNVPPSLKMLGVSPQSKLNCEVLNDDLAFEVRWAVAGDSIVVQLVSKLDDNEYMSFGLSGDDNHSVMVKGDVVVAWMDKATLKGYAEDYYLDAKSQCSGKHGSCPDDRFQDRTNNIRLLNAAMVNGYSIVTYQRTLKPSDKYDRQIYSNRSQAIIWAIGPLNQRNEVSFHSQYLKVDQFINFGRQPKWNCPMPASDKSSYPSTTTLSPYIETAVKSASQRGGNRFVSVEPEINSRSGANDRSSSDRSNTRGRGSSNRSRQSTNESRNHISRANITTTTPRPVPTPKPVPKSKAWNIPAIECNEPDDGVFYAQMGPTGGKQGYPAITGHVGWGISWYINGLLIPEINVVRGQTYTFVTEGGIDPQVPAKYHPFYITDDPVGGFEYKTPEEKANVRIFAGVSQSPTGEVYPTGVGRLCHWTPRGNDVDPDEFVSFGGYQRHLELICDAGTPGVVTWTPDQNTPNTVYYQCFTHRYLGWKINVLDSCDISPQASEYVPSYVSSPMDTAEQDDFKASASINVETRVKPSEIYLGNNMNNFYNTDIYRKNLLYLGNSYYHFPSTPSSNFKPSPQILTSSLQHDASSTASSVIFKNSAINIITPSSPIEINNNTTTSSPIITTAKPYEDTTIVTDATAESITESSIITTVTPDIDETTQVPDNESAETRQNISNKLIQETPYALPLIAIYPKINTSYGNKLHIKPPINVPNYQPAMPAHSMGPRFGITTHHHTRPYRPLYTNPNFTMKKPYYRNQNKRPVQMSTILRPVIHAPPKTLHPKPVMMFIPNKPQHHFHSNRGDIMTTTLQFPHKHVPSQNNLKQKIILNGNILSQMQHKINLNNFKNVSNTTSFKPLNKNDFPQVFKHFNHLEKSSTNIVTAVALPPPPPPPPNQSHITFTNESPKKIIPLVEHIQNSEIKQFDIKNKTQNFERVTTPSTTTQSSPYLHTSTKKIILNTYTTIKPYPPSKMISIQPDFRQKFTTTLEPAINTGFRPDSVIIEGGFKPIITKINDPNIIAQDRISDLDIEPMSDNIGVIDLSNQHFNDFSSSQQSTETFEPMFIPSPPDSRQSEYKLNLQTSKQNSILNSRNNVDETQINNSIRSENLDGDEMVMAAERIDSFYLPPATVNLKPKQQHLQPQQSDLSVPSGSIVTYDGKLLSDISLSPPLPAFPSHPTSGGLSKIEQFVRNTPQFVPFKGELPPSVPEMIQIDSLPQLKPNTKLIKSPRRKRRSPHHTPEHTAEQTKSRSSTLVITTYPILFTGMILILLSSSLLRKF